MTGSLDVFSMIGIFTALPINDRNKNITEYSGGKPSFVKARPMRSILTRKKITPSRNSKSMINVAVILLWM